MTETKAPRNRPSDDLLGQKFNFLTIDGFQFDAKYKVWKMEVVCDCGNRSLAKLFLLKNGERKTCGVRSCPHFHHVRKTNGRSVNFTGCEEIYGSRWGGWRCGAVARNLEFSVTPEFGWDLFLKQNRKCALSGVELTFGNSWNQPCTASLDRINSSIGYTESNVQWVHKQINLMKRAISDEDFINWCSLVLRHRQKADTNPVS